MLQTKSMLFTWGIGLSEAQATYIQKSLGDGSHLINRTIDEVSSLTELEKDNPCLVWLSAEVCRALHANPENRQLSLIPKALFLDQGYAIADFDRAMDLGITEIIRPPMTKEQILDVFLRAVEAHELHNDLACMSREIILDRELLERKNELLAFMVNFLANATESLDIPYLLETAFSSFSKLLPMQSLHAVIWEENEQSEPVLSLYVAAVEGSSACAAWRERLLDHARKNIGDSFSVADVHRIHPTGQRKEADRIEPDDGVILYLPIISSHVSMGALLLSTTIERHLGRDQSLALDSAMSHFALTIRNALRFRVMQMQADYDVLTKIHSRRHFESRLDEEVQRCLRYGQPLSMIMLDIDHFKLVNDNHGHHAGDKVLREVATVITQSIRATDYCARYGGEEFAVLMPHADRNKAKGLAERIRVNIVEHTFELDDGVQLSITVSLGVASLSAKSSKNKQVLVQEADVALYEAKAQGRNKVCLADLRFSPVSSQVG